MIENGVLFELENRVSELEDLVKNGKRRFQGRMVSEAVRSRQGRRMEPDVLMRSLAAMNWVADNVTVLESMPHMPHTKTWMTLLGLYQAYLKYGDVGERDEQLISLAEFKAALRDFPTVMVKRSGVSATGNMWLVNVRLDRPLHIDSPSRPLCRKNRPPAPVGE